MWLKDEEIIKTEDEIIRYIKEYEPTAFYHRESCSLYVFSERLSFSIKKHPDEKKYGARFVRSIEARGSMGKGYIHAKTIEEIKEKLKIQAKKYYKNRLKLAIQGKTYDMIPKFLHAIYEKEVKKKIEINTTLSQKELNEKLKKSFIHLEIKEMDGKVFNSYIEELKIKKQRKKPKKGIEIDSLCIFIYDNRIDVIEKTN